MDSADVGFSMSTVNGSGLLPGKPKPYAREELNLCMFTLEADYKESQVNDEALLHESAQRNRILCRENEFPSSTSLCVVKSRNSSKRAASLDFLENVLPYEDIAQLGSKSGGKSFWKNLRFWQRTEKNAGSCLSVTSSAQQSDFKLGGHRQKLTRAKREVLGPLYTDGSSLYSDSRIRPNPYPVIDAPLCGKSDGNVCPYMPLNRFQRIPSGPLYLP